MNLIRDSWSKKDITEFQKYLTSFKDESKVEWSRNLLKTNLPVLAIKTPVIRDIAKNIAKGNYLSFLDLMIWEYYENTSINGSLICKIEDFNTMKKYLDIYSSKADNWATCDLLSFNIKGKEKEFFDLLKIYIKSDKPFVRRIGIVILFNFVDYKEYLNDIYNILNSFKDESEYYVNMINAWLVCECFIKHRDETIKFLDSNTLNKFTINKAVQKCRDSYRVSKEDKEALLKYKK